MMLDLRLSRFGDSYFAVQLLASASFIPNGNGPVTHPIPLVNATPLPLAAVLVVSDFGHASAGGTKHLSNIVSPRLAIGCLVVRAYGNDDSIGNQGLKGDGHRGECVGLAN